MAWSLTTTQIPESIEHFMSIIGYYTISKPLISSNISELFFVVKQYESTSLKRYTELGGGFKHFLFSPLLGEMIQFDWYFSDGLKPPTRLKKSRIFKTYSQKKESRPCFWQTKKCQTVEAHLELQILKAQIGASDKSEEAQEVKHEAGWPVGMDLINDQLSRRKTRVPHINQTLRSKHVSSRFHRFQCMQLPHVVEIAWWISGKFGDVLVDIIYTVAKVDGDRHSQWCFRKGPWQSNTWELRHLLSKLFRICSSFLWPIHDIIFGTSQ